MVAARRAAQCRAAACLMINKENIPMPELSAGKAHRLYPSLKNNKNKHQEGNKQCHN